MDFRGAANEAIKHYMEGIRRCEVSDDSCSLPGFGEGNGEARFVKVQVTDADGRPSDSFFIGDTARVEIEVIFEKPVKAAQIGFIIRSVTAGGIYHCVTRDAGLEASDLFGRVTFTATFASLRLYPGEYVLGDLSIDTPNETLQFIPDALCFRVAEGGPKVYRYLSGHAAVVHEVPEWRLERNGVHLEGLQPPKETVGADARASHSPNS